MVRKYTLIIATVIVTLALLWLMSPIPPDWPVTLHAQGGTYPQGFELLCPAGSQALSQLVTYNPSTQRFRANYCIDPNGTVTQVSGANPGGANTLVQYNNNGVFAGAPGFTFITASGRIIINAPGVSFPLTVQDGSGSNIAFANIGPPLGWTMTTYSVGTTTFASIGSVPGAGQNSKYCTDCTTAATCAGAGSGHMAVSNGTNWTCQ